MNQIRFCMLSLLMLSNSSNCSGATPERSLPDRGRQNSSSDASGATEDPSSADAEATLRRFGFTATESRESPFSVRGRASCEAGDHIFLFTADSQLLRFDPRTNQFSKLGMIECPGQTVSPNSMAIDRAANAWIGFHDGSIFKVDTRTCSCEPSGYERAQLGWTSFGMAFVGGGSDAPEILYLSDGQPLVEPDGKSRGIGRVDPDRLRLQLVGMLDGELQGRACELTGLETGVLHAFCPGKRALLALVNPRDASVNATVQLPLGAVGAFAIAQWGGSDYVFTSPARGTPSRVDRYLPGYGMKRIVERAGFEIIGAGVSTCAPVGPD